MPAPISASTIDIATQAFQDQKPGTSGLRKKVAVFQKPDYTENFIQATLEATGKPKFLVVGGDGRFYSDEAIKKIINVCAANGVERMVVPRNGILSTPAASALIRSLKADGGIILTASHNPGGPDGDFGIKFNISNGGPAPESVTNKIYEISKTLTSYKSLLKRPQLDLNPSGGDEATSLDVASMKLEIVDPISNYAKLMREVFDFDQIRKLFTGEVKLATHDGQQQRQFRMLADPMNGVVGPYARRILVEEIGAQSESVINSVPLPDFGGKHPDPNLTYARDLVSQLKADNGIDFGVAFDGDGDRNMVLGRGGLFVTPGDSLAVIAAHLDKIKWFSASGAKGFARSFPTAPAVDRVAKARGVACYETPTGWKFFGNLLDANKLSLCGEESFGIGSDHIREKDGLWACLAWLSIIAATGKTVEQLVQEHWQQFGRDYFCRYDYEDCDASKCQAMIKDLETRLSSKQMLGRPFGPNAEYTVASTGNFEYTDPVDQSVSSNQGLYVRFENGARIIIRLSGTGSSGATVRLYVSDYSKTDLTVESQAYLKHLLEIALKITKLKEYTEREEPTVIT